MSLYWVTGSAGTGKSTVSTALREKGYISYDVDNDGLARWTNLSTGYVHPKSSVKQDQRTSEFIKAHGWFVPRSSIEQVHREADGKLGFICGALDNYDELSDFFSGIIALYVDGQTLVQRLSTRGPREWGSQKHELKQTLERHQAAYDTWKSMGAVIVNSSVPLEQVVDDVISAASTLTK
jgi:dephospho-CoA kinase